MAHPPQPPHGEVQVPSDSNVQVDNGWTENEIAIETDTTFRDHACESCMTVPKNGTT